jgi:hypothetical protein
MEQRQKQKIKFDEIKDKVLSALHERAEIINIAESVTLVEGFLNEPFSTELSTSIIIGGPTIPMVMLVGNESGKIYFFALKTLVKELWT